MRFAGRWTDHAPHSSPAVVGVGLRLDPYSGLAPLYIQVGGDETLLDDTVRIVAKAEEAGVDVTSEVFPEMQHVFQFAAGRMPEADDAVAKIGEYLRPRLGL